MWMYQVLIKDSSCGAITVTGVAEDRRGFEDLVEGRMRDNGIGLDGLLDCPGRTIVMECIGEVSVRSTFMSCAQILNFNDKEWSEPEGQTESVKQFKPAEPDTPPQNIEQAVLVAVRSGSGNPAQIVKTVRKSGFKKVAASTVTSALSKLKRHGVIVNPRRGVWKMA